MQMESHVHKHHQVLHSLVRENLP